MAFIIPNATDTSSGQRFANLDQAEPDSLDFQILGHASTNSVVSGCAVTSNSNTQVNVASGTVLIDGTEYAVTGNASFALPTAPSLARFDLVVARLSGSSVSLVGVQGNDNLTNPEFPPSLETLQSGVIFDATQHIDFSTDVVLAAVYRVGSANILDANIADKRIFAPKITGNQVTGIAGSGLALNSGLLDVQVDDSTIEINNDDLQVKDDGVTNAKLSDMVAHSVKVNATSSAANPTDLAISANEVLGRGASGSLVSTQVQTGMIAIDAVTAAKIDSDVAGAGLTQDSNGALQVNPDNVTIEISSDAVRLKNTTVTAGTYGSASEVGQFTVDAKGRITGATNVAIAIAQSAVSGLTTALAGKLSTTGKAADSELLDGIDSGSFLRSDANDSFSGRLTATYNQGTNPDWSNAQIIVNSGGDAAIALRTNNQDTFTVQLRAGGNPIASNREQLYVRNHNDTLDADIQFGDLVTSSGYMYVENNIGTFRFKTNALIGGAYPYADVECLSLTETSARRFKENIVDAYLPEDTDALDTIREIDFAEFSYVGRDPNHRVKGVIADDLIYVMPEAVRRDDSGEIASVETQRMTYLALGALKQALTKIDALEAQVAELSS
jgi:hypothetical protein